MSGDTGYPVDSMIFHEELVSSDGRMILDHIGSASLRIHDEPASPLVKAPVCRGKTSSSAIARTYIPS